MTEHPREYPQFPIPAVGAIVLNEGHILLIRRGKPPARGKWSLPGGAIELGESPKDALRREVREECGLDVSVGRFVTTVDMIVRDDTGRIHYHYLILDYLAFCRIGKGCRKLPLQAGTDVTDACWVPLHDVTSCDVTDGLMCVIDQAVAMIEKSE